MLKPKRQPKLKSHKGKRHAVYSESLDNIGDKLNAMLTDEPTFENTMSFWALVSNLAVIFKSEAARVRKIVR